MNQFSKLRILILFILFSLPLITNEANAIDTLPIENEPVIAGIGIGTVSDYDGSDDYIIGAAPFLKYTLKGHEQFIMLTVTEIRINVLDHPWLRMGPSLNYRFARADVRDHYVDRMRDIDGTVEGGGWFGVEFVDKANPRKRFNADIDILSDITNEHDGFAVFANIRGWHPISEMLDAGIGITMSYGSKNFMDTYFSVDNDNSHRSGLPVFHATSGIKDFRINPALVMHLNYNWHLAAGMQYRRLVNDAADSPVVELRGSSNQFIAGLGLAYSW